MSAAERKHSVKFIAGYDCIRFECVNGAENCKPGFGGSHGCHGLNILFVSQGQEGAVQFLMFTGWIPQYAEQSSIGVRSIRESGLHMMPADLGYHSKTPRYEGQNKIQEACEFCDGQPCYYDGSSLNANDAMYALVNGGDDALWRFLDAYYASVFEAGEYPAPAEYKMPLRKDGAAISKLELCV